MAEAIARHRYPELMEASSAGLVAFGSVQPETRAVLVERGIPGDGLLSQQLTKEKLRGADIVINMSGRSGAQLAFQGGPRIEDWEVGDPFGSDLDVYRNICDEIESRLANFAEELRSLPKAEKKTAAPAPRATRRAKRGN
jgi:protein-tyrosine-phosphatase